mmetsp:Transcript_8000/g.11413  ORF Transcript_8000/g.11413 Transcript_8000/m.11413 type:complete len:282 (-) Transcript_8000:716-1561(-)
MKAFGLLIFVAFLTDDGPIGYPEMVSRLFLFAPVTLAIVVAAEAFASPTPFFTSSTGVVEDDEDDANEELARNCCSRCSRSLSSNKRKRRSASTQVSEGDFLIGERGSLSFLMASHLILARGFANSSSETDGGMKVGPRLGCGEAVDNVADFGFSSKLDFSSFAFFAPDISTNTGGDTSCCCCCCLSSRVVDRKDLKEPLDPGLFFFSIEGPGNGRRLRGRTTCTCTGPGSICAWGWGPLTPLNNSILLAVEVGEQCFGDSGKEPSETMGGIRVAFIELLP